MVTHERITVAPRARLQFTAGCAKLLTCAQSAATIPVSRHGTVSSHVRNGEMSLDTGRTRSLEREGIQACLVYAGRLVGHERVEPLEIDPAA